MRIRIFQILICRVGRSQHHGRARSEERHPRGYFPGDGLPAGPTTLMLTQKDGIRRLSGVIRRLDPTSGRLNISSLRTISPEVGKSFDDRPRTLRNSQNTMQVGGPHYLIAVRK